jgi:hypothetical protein
MTTASPAKASARPAHELASPAKFFAAIRPLSGTLTPAQVQGIEAKLAAFAAAASPIAHIAYGLATSFHETARKMQPVEEIGRGRGKPYGKSGAHRGQVPYGRGNVQLTWDGNYEKADAELDLDGSLLADFGRALETDISARIMVRGIIEGWFAGDKIGRHKLSRYLPAKGAASLKQFIPARRIINGVDRAGLVAEYAITFQTALNAG